MALPSSPLCPADQENPEDHDGGACQSLADVLLAEPPRPVENPEEKAQPLDGDHVGRLDLRNGHHVGKILHRRREADEQHGAGPRENAARTRAACGHRPERDDDHGEHQVVDGGEKPRVGMKDGHLPDGCRERVDERNEQHDPGAGLANDGPDGPQQPRLHFREIEDVGPEDNQEDSQGAARPDRLAQDEAAREDHEYGCEGQKGQGERKRRELEGPHVEKECGQLQGKGRCDGKPESPVRHGGGKEKQRQDHPGGRGQDADDPHAVGRKIAEEALRQSIGRGQAQGGEQRKEKPHAPSFTTTGADLHHQINRTFVVLMKD